MNIIVNKENATNWSHRTGGEYAIPSLEIFIDSNLPPREQSLLVIHAVLEIYFCSVSHDKIDEVCEFITEALDQLNSE